MSVFVLRDSPRIRPPSRSKVRQVPICSARAALVFEPPVERMDSGAVNRNRSPSAVIARL